MKLAFRISIWLNLGLLGCLVYFLSNRPKETAVLTVVKPVALAKPVASSKALPKPFRWSQLESTNDYGVYVANLRAIGCPEPTVEVIVSGDAERGFSFERNLLGLDGSGTGKWSRLAEAQTVAKLLGRPVPVAGTETAATGSNSLRQMDAGSAVAQTHANSNNEVQNSDVPEAPQDAQQQPSRMAVYVPAYPLAFQNVNMDDLQLSDSQKAAIQQVQQQFISAVGGQNQNPGDPAYLAKWQTAQSDADDSMKALLGSQAYMAYQQQQYYDWYEPQVMAANSAGQPLTINPGSFSSSK